MKNEPLFRETSSPENLEIRKELLEFREIIKARGGAKPGERFPVIIGLSNLEAAVFNALDDKLELHLFLHNSSFFSRKTLSIDREGNVEDITKALPYAEITFNEPKFSGFTDEQLAQLVVAQIKDELTIVN